MSRKRKRKEKQEAPPAPVRRGATPAQPGRSGAVGSAVDRILVARWVLPSILVLSGVLRLANIAFLRGTPFVDELQLDHAYYDEWAQRIAGGDWTGGKGPFWVDPLYAYFLAGLYAVFGRSLVLVRVVQAFFGVATCYLAALLGRRISGSAAVGTLTALLIGLFIPAVYYDGTLEKTSLCLVLVTGALVLYFGSSLRSLLLSGVALGLAVLSRGNLLLMVVLGAAALASHRAVPSSLRGRAVRAGAFLAGALAMIGLATIRNMAVSGEFIPTTANFGQNLYVGQVCASGDGSYSCPFLRPDPQFEEGDFRTEAERRVQHPLTAAETSAYWGREAMKAMSAEPSAVFQRAGRNLRLFFHEYENSDNHSVDVQAENSPVLRLALLWMGQLFPLSILGAFVSWRKGRPYRLLAWIVVVYCASMLPFMVFARYRATVLPCLAVLAAMGLLWLKDAIRERAWQSLAFATVLMTSAGLFSLAWPAWMVEAHEKSMGMSFHDMGEDYLRRGKEDDAIRAFERAVAIKPETFIGSMRRLGDLYLARKDYPRAERYMLRVLQLKPNSPLARSARVQLYTSMLEDDRYRNDSSVKEKLAMARDAVSGTAGSREAPPDHATGPLGAGTRDAILARLRGEAPGTPVWLRFDDGSQASRELASTLRDLFTKAGWQIRAERALSFHSKPGLFVYAADERPPGYVQAVYDALVAGGLKPFFATGYREYYSAQIAKDPGFRGLSFDDDQTYVLVVGPNA